MRKRSCFISNSSSSSFMVTVSIVENEELFKKFEEEIGEKFERLTYDEMLEEKRHCGDFLDYMWGMKFEEYSDKTFILESDMNDFPEYTEDEDGNINYEANYDDVDESEFSERMLKIYSAGKEQGIKQLYSTYYAGRNG